MMKILSYVLAILLGSAAAIGLSTSHPWSAAATPSDPAAGPEHHEPAAAAPPPSPVLLARLGAIEDFMAAFDSRLETLEIAVDEATTEHAAEALPALAAAETHPSEQPLPEVDEDPEARYREMQTLLASQEPDPAWETMAITDITSTFEQAAPGTVIENVACTGRVCRVDLHHEPGATLDDVLLSDALVSWPHRGMAQQIDDESSVLFLVSEQP